MAAVVVAHLEAMGADVYQEVPVSGGFADIVATEPGRTMGEVIKGMRHHYGSDRSARAVLLRWVEAGHLKIEIRQEGKDRRLYPLAAAPGRRVR